MLMDIDKLLSSVGARIRDPQSGRSLAAQGSLRAGRLEGDTLCFEIVVSAEHDQALRSRLMQQVERLCNEAGWKGPIRAKLVELEPAPAAPDPHASSHAHHPSHGAPSAVPTPERLPGVRHIVAVASGKGGVGKSTVALHLALGLQKRGLRVGLLDADIYGPSLPILLGVHESPEVGEGERLVPIRAHGLACMSIGFLLGAGRPVIWRGPMVMGIVRQFLQQVDWAPLDVLVIDLPPGTGDAQLTLVQTVPLSGALIVTTPQELALADAERGLAMFRQLDVPVLGIVENMAWYELPDGTRDHPFGQGGAARLGQKYGVDSTAGIPLDGRIRASGDSGDPSSLSGPAVQAFAVIAEKVSQKLGL